MFAQVINRKSNDRLLVRLVTADPAMEKRLRTALVQASRYHLDVVRGSVSQRQGELAALPPTSLLICDIDQADPTEWQALEKVLAQSPTRPAVILLSNRLDDAGARRLLRLQITDWMPRDSSEAELASGCENALKPQANGSGHHAHCIAFMSAVGGAGSTTLGLAAASILAGKSKGGLERACAVDLDFHFGSVPDHLDLAPNLQLREVSATPERLDAHLLEVMLTRHRSGLAMLASPPSLERDEVADIGLVGRLLDLAVAKFDHVVIDLPHAVQPWTENVVRGADRVYIVTELSVIGLRQARRMCDAMAKHWGLPVEGSVIVNKYSGFGLRGMRKRHAREILGTRLAGFVANQPRIAREAQDRGVLLSEIKRSNSIEKDLRAIVTKT